MAFQVDCVNCHRRVPADNLDLSTGWAKCPSCDQVFAIAEVEPSFPHPEVLLRRGEPLDPGTEVSQVLERPFDARAVVEETGDSLLIHIPATGMNSGTWGLLLFALFWNGFLVFWTGGALLAAFGGGMGGAGICFPLFSIPFWAVGMFLIGTVAWMRFGTRSVHLDASEMHVQSRCLFWKRHRRFPRENVQRARIAEQKITTESGRPLYAAMLEIVHTGGAYSLPCQSVDERDWLIGVVNRFLERYR